MHLVDLNVKITSTKPSKYCNSYKNRKEETCPLCHNYYKNTMQEKYKESCTKKIWCRKSNEKY